MKTVREANRRDNTKRTRRVKVVCSKILMRSFSRSVGTMCQIHRFAQVVVRAETRSRNWPRERDAERKDE